MAELSKQTEVNDPSKNQEVQRVHIALFLVTLVALVLGGWQLRNSIRLPFVQPALTNQAAGTAANPEPGASELKTRDTDGDSLNDWDEQYVYATSAYLTDTDSDSYSDEEEVRTGNNPNCPAHQTCLVQVASFTSGQTTPRTAAELREILRGAGVSGDELNKIDDTTLLQVYGEVLTEPTATTSGSGQGPAPASRQTSEGAQTLTSEQQKLLGSMSGTELRKFLKDSGVESPALDQLDDTTLKALVSQALGL